MHLESTNSWGTTISVEMSYRLDIIKPHIHTHTHTHTHTPQVLCLSFMLSCSFTQDRLCFLHSLVLLCRHVIQFLTIGEKERERVSEANRATGRANVSQKPQQRQEVKHGTSVVSDVYVLLTPEEVFLQLMSWKWNSFFQAPGLLCDPYASVSVLRNGLIGVLKGSHVWRWHAPHAGSLKEVMSDWAVYASGVLKGSDVWHWHAPEMQHIYNFFTCCFQACVCNRVCVSVASGSACLLPDRL